MNRPPAQDAPTLAGLLAACAGGDRAAFAQLYSLTSPKLYGVALRILKQEQQAQECLQDAYLNVWRRASTYQAGKSAPMTWLVSIVRNRALDLVRRSRPEEVPTDDPEAWERRADPPADWVPAAMQGRDIERCLDELEPAQRRCLLLAYYEGLTHTELAARTEHPLGTVKTWIRRALQQMKQCLER